MNWISSAPRSTLNSRPLSMNSGPPYSTDCAGASNENDSRPHESIPGTVPSTVAVAMSMRYVSPSAAACTAAVVPSGLIETYPGTCPMPMTSVSVSVPRSTMWAVCVLMPATTAVCPSGVTSTDCASPLIGADPRNARVSASHKIRFPLSRWAMMIVSPSSVKTMSAGESPSGSLPVSTKTGAGAAPRVPNPTGPAGSPYIAAACVAGITRVSACASPFCKPPASAAAVPAARTSEATETAIDSVRHISDLPRFPGLRRAAWAAAGSARLVRPSLRRATQPVYSPGPEIQPDLDHPQNGA